MAEPVPTPPPWPRAIRHDFATPNAQLALRMYAPAAGVAIVSADGEIDLANRDALAAALTPAAADPDVRRLCCDLSATTFLACSGLSVLLDVKSAVESRGAALRVVTADATVLRVFDATGLWAALDVRPELADAMPGYEPAGTRAIPLAEAMADAQTGTNLDGQAEGRPGGLDTFGDRSGTGPGDSVAARSADRDAADTGQHGDGPGAGGDLAELAAAPDRAGAPTSGAARTP